MCFTTHVCVGTSRRDEISSVDSAGSKEKSTRSGFF